jgi:4'-phosphopantetheinyl transferase
VAVPPWAEPRAGEREPDPELTEVIAWLLPAGLPNPLRTVLGRRLGVDPASLVFERGPQDRPELAGRALRFSLAHSGGLALVAVTERADVGADLERMDAALAQPPSAERFFAPVERARLERLAGRARLRLFFELWTEKEAYRKATGEGITAGLGELEWTGWTLFRPPVPDGYAAAIAVRAPDAVLTVAIWPP